MARRAILVWVWTALAAAQQMDTANFSSGRMGGSLADRAESAAERRDYLEMAKAREAPERRRRADEFVARYPRSPLLASAYQASAAASIELRDYQRAVADGRQSLRLLPENAPLLVALAQIEAGSPQSLRDAEDALLWLSAVAGPVGVGAKEWARSRQELAQAARRLLAQAGGRRMPPWATPAETPAKADALPCAGSEACRECHRAIYDSWRQTGMSAMLRPLGEGALLADFSQAGEFTDSDGKVAVRMGGGSQPYFEFPVAGGWKRYRVAYTIGSKWQQAYATRLSDGRVYVFPIQYSALRRSWLNYWARIDPPGSERTQIQRFPELSPATSYQRNCAVCHTSQLRLRRLDDASLQDAAFREPGVDCEMCHGPSGGHIAAVRSGGESAGDGPPFRFARLDHWRGTMICGQCHRQSALRELGTHGEMNYTSGPPYFFRLVGQPPAESGTRAFYKDGRYRETTFIGEAFLRSACFRRGTAQCASCHDPHPADPRTNRNSLRFPGDPDRMCLQCHTALIPRVAQHTHHGVESAGSRCVACHVPPIMNSLLFGAASHQIEIPSAEMTARFGAQESPNACLLCHRERDAEWVSQALKNW